MFGDGIGEYAANSLVTLGVFFQAALLGPDGEELAIARSFEQVSL